MSCTAARSSCRRDHRHIVVGTDGSDDAETRCAAVQLTEDATCCCTEETRDVLLLQSLRASLEGAFRELAEILDFAAHAP